MRLVEFLRSLLPLVKVPSLEEEAELRDFLRRVLVTAGAIASYTRTPLDDLAVTALRAIVGSDEVWQAFYALLKFVAANQELGLLVARTGLSEAELLELRNAIYDRAHSDSAIG